MKYFLTAVFVFYWSLQGFAEVVINEIHYNPPDDHLEDGSFREFVELYNSGDASVNLTDYEFTSGISFRFPTGTRIAARGYVIVAYRPTHPVWRSFSMPIYGPYTGKLANDGERITLTAPDGTIVDQVQYSDLPPWPLAADGYGASLERISPDLPTQDHHSWRASLKEGGTPGRENSVTGTPPAPVILAYEYTPRHPTSSDDVRIQFSLNTPENIESATLLWETAGNSASNPKSVPLVLQDRNSQYTVLSGTIPAQSSQTLVRFNIEVKLHNGENLHLPHAAEPQPFLSYFVYDGEVKSNLPILWILQPVTSSLVENGKRIGGVVSLPLDRDQPDVFDGALVLDSHLGQKVRFLKGQEFYGDRTINIIPEAPTGGTNAGFSSPFREHLGYWFYREMGVISPWAEFYRIIPLPYSPGKTQTQQLIVEQVNEKFLEKNGLNPDGDLYKRVYTNPNWEKHTNKEAGTGSIEDLVNTIGNPSTRPSVIENRLDREEFLRYSVTSVLTSNWDGFWNNNWMYLPAIDNPRWVIIPWDLDWLWGSTTQGLYAKMPLTFPIDGVATGGTQASRPPGPVTAPLHRDEEFYEDYIRQLRYHLDNSFTEDKLFGKLRETQQTMLEDLLLIADQTGRGISTRDSQIRQSITQIETFIEQRREYLNSVLPVEVEDWGVYE